MWTQALWGGAQSEVRMEAETRVTRTPAKKCPEEQEASSPRPREKPRLCPLWLLWWEEWLSHHIMEGHRPQPGQQRQASAASVDSGWGWMYVFFGEMSI